ncbi:hypothetical protein SARC_11446 [Sphaeroforma arctica JP610]|uniref:Uncharacterized protein n=1 Tax=Sphaeroforma arctica JP610 TaxID=667725 RepID=A0A0L0FH12_9EUKA|nr:hypothetical protein SARC_11446 [Sphaeroforma arctica JP610]KNC76040.1 hypothetical protein SARC_11446 [Sphaeroforma arctica JP610]|eukprot:XP_014149942.1 hypothetical protein SARC_11446 [Sphaeroforma arctica JP610]
MYLCPIMPFSIRNQQQATLDALYAWILEEDEAVDMSAMAEHLEMVKETNERNLSNDQTSNRSKLSNASRMNSANSIPAPMNIHDEKEEHSRTVSGIDWSLPAVKNTTVTATRYGQYKKYPTSPTNDKINNQTGDRSRPSNTSKWNCTNSTPSPSNIQVDKKEYSRTDSGIEWSLPAVENKTATPIRYGLCKKYPASPTNGRIDDLATNSKLYRRVSSMQMPISVTARTLCRRARSSDVKISPKSDAGGILRMNCNDITPMRNKKSANSPTSAANFGDSTGRSLLCHRQPAYPLASPADFNPMRPASLSEMRSSADKKVTVSQEISAHHKDGKSGFLRQFSMPGLRRGGAPGKHTKSFRILEVEKGAPGKHTKPSRIVEAEKAPSFAGMDRQIVMIKRTNSIESSSPDIFEFGADFDSPLAAVAVDCLVDGVRVNTRASKLVGKAIHNMENERRMFNRAYS